MSAKQQLLEARDLIKEKRYHEARVILSNIDHPTAQEWIAKIDQLTATPPSEQRASRSSRPRVDDLRAETRRTASGSLSGGGTSLIDQLTGEYFFAVLGGIVIMIIVIVVGIFVAGGDGGGGGGSVALGQSASFSGATIQYPDGWATQIVEGQLILVSSADLLNEFQGDPTTAELPRGAQAVAVGFQDTSGLDIPIEATLELVRGFMLAGAEELGGDLSDVSDIDTSTINGNDAASFQFAIEGQTIKMVVMEAGGGQIAIFIGISHDFGDFNSTFMSMVRSAQF